MNSNTITNTMKNLCKLVLASLFALAAACDEYSAQEKPPNGGGYHASESAKGSIDIPSIHFVAGLLPNQRPAGAPVIREFAPDTHWRVQALAGVSEPIPPLGFIDSQGAWYTPFNHPGMPGYYDLRNWHPGTRAQNPAAQ
jgi:hypothetical protein